MIFARCIRARMLGIAITLACVPSLQFGQAVPCDGNLYGQPIISGNGFFAVTSGNVYVPSDIGNANVDYHHYRSIYTAPYYLHIVNISYSGGKPLPSGDSQGIVHIQLSNGTIVGCRIHNLYSSGHFQEWYPDSTFFVDIAPVDSTEWKKLIGDAVYALGTPWFSSSPMLYVSRDSLRTWQVDTTGIDNADIQDITLDTAQYVYAATDKGLLVQNPDSNIWHKVTSLSQLTSLNHVFVDRENRILASGVNGGLYVSTNNGTSWSAAPTGLGANVVGIMSDDAFHNLFVTAAPSAFSSSRLYRSVGGTGTWQLVDTSISRIVGSASFQNTQINTISGDSVLMAGTSFGIFTSTDQGITWSVNNNGIRAKNISGIARTGSGKILLTTDLGIFSNSPPDTVWTKSYPINGFQGPPYQLKLYSDGLGNIYTLDGEHYPSLLINGISAVVMSTDGGTSWAADTAGLSAVNGNQFYVDENGTQHYGGGGQYTNIKSALWAKPSGGSWTVDTAGFPVSTSNYVTALTSDHNGYLYASGNLSGKKVLRRPIAGGAWVVDTAGIPAATSVMGLLVAGMNGDVFGYPGQYYGTSILRRSAGTWSNVSLPSQLIAPYVTFLSVDKSGVLFASFVDNNNVGRGVWFSANNGTPWTYAGLDSSSVTSLVSFGDSTYALTQNAGAFYVGKNPSATNVTSRTTTPQSFVLFQNYPNPFNPLTIVNFQLPVASHVSLDIFDLLGRHVESLVNGEMSAGLHQATFDASKFASGIYLYRMRAGVFTETKKLIVLK